MNPQGCERVLLIKAIDVNVGVLQRTGRSEAQMTKMEVVSAAKESAEFSAFGASGCHATQGIATRIVAVVATVDSSVKIKAAIVWFPEAGSTKSAMLSFPLGVHSVGSFQFSDVEAVKVIAIAGVKQKTERRAPDKLQTSVFHIVQAS
jgi:hypothetical protein